MPVMAPRTDDRPAMLVVRLYRNRHKTLNPDPRQHYSAGRPAPNHLEQSQPTLLELRLAAELAIGVVPAFAAARTPDLEIDSAIAVATVLVPVLAV